MAQKKKTYRSKAYMDFVKGLECVVGHWLCDGKEVHAHHAGMGGVGLKAPDLTCIPLCSRHHAIMHLNGKKSFEDCQGIDIAKEVTRANQAYIEYLEQK